MKNDRYIWVKALFSVLAIALAAFRLVDIGGAGQQMDTTFLALVAAAFLVFVIPWQQLRSFKAGGVELILDEPRVRGALDGLELERVDSRRLRQTLSELEPDIKLASGSRVLWIDDQPHEILGERRLLRALGIEVVTAGNSEVAGEILRGDNDFDMIISDVQRRQEVDGRETIYGGMYFIKELREDWKDPVVRSLPVIFYSAYREDQIERITNEVSGRPLTGTEFNDSIETLLTRCINILSEVRSNPIKVRPQKKATSPR